MKIVPNFRGEALNLIQVIVDLYLVEVVACFLEKYVSQRFKLTFSLMLLPLEG